MLRKLEQLCALIAASGLGVEVGAGGVCGSGLGWGWGTVGTKKLLLGALIGLVLIILIPPLVGGLTVGLGGVTVYIIGALFWLDGKLLLLET